MSWFFNNKVDESGDSFKEYTIDCDVVPYVPHHFEVFEHKKMGLLSFIPAKIKLYPACFERNKFVSVESLKYEYFYKTSLNANVLDYLWKNKSLIPNTSDWRFRKVFFLGTVYRHENGDIMVPYLRRLFWLNENDNLWERGEEFIKWDKLDDMCVIAFM